METNLMDEEKKWWIEKKIILLNSFQIKSHTAKQKKVVHKLVSKEVIRFIQLVGISMVDAKYVIGYGFNCSCLVCILFASKF